MLIKLKGAHLQVSNSVEKVDGCTKGNETLVLDGDLLWDSNTLLIDDDRVLCTRKEYESKYSVIGDDETNYRTQMVVQLILRRQSPDSDEYLRDVCEKLGVPDAAEGAIGVLTYYSCQENLGANIYLDPQTYDLYRDMALRKTGPLQVNLAWFYLKGALEKDFFLKSVTSRLDHWLTGRDEESLFIANIPINNFNLTQMVEDFSSNSVVSQLPNSSNGTDMGQKKGLISRIAWFAWGAAFAFLLAKCS